MFDFIFGLPMHALVVHAVVVLVPLAALGAIAFAVLPLWRPVLRWPTAVGALFSGVVTWVAAASGEALLSRVSRARPTTTDFALLQTHVDRGYVVRIVATIFMVLVLAAVAILKPLAATPRDDGRSRRSSASSSSSRPSSSSSPWSSPGTPARQRSGRTSAEGTCAAPAGRGAVRASSGSAYASCVSLPDSALQTPASPTSRVRRWVRPILVANLMAEVGIVVTGGIVRLTGSGLGCSTWPECQPGSFTPVRTPESAYHDLIEFGNRTLTGVLAVLAVLSAVVVVRTWPGRRRMHAIAYGVVAGVAAQAVAGGITVRTGLNPWTVMFHFLVSMILVALSTALVRGARDEASGPGELTVHPLARALAWGTAAVGMVVLVLGVVVTGSGPHSGDADTPARTGFDPRFVSWMHADAVMFFSGLVIATIVAVRITAVTDEAKRAWNAVLYVTIAQGFIGYLQYFTGLPALLVLLHMLGASLLVVVLTLGVLETRRLPV